MRALYLCLIASVPLVAQFTPAAGYCSMAHCDSAMSDQATLSPPLTAQGFRMIDPNGGASVGLGCSTNGTIVACNNAVSPGGMVVYSKAGRKLCDSGSTLDANSYRSAPAIDSTGLIITADGTHVAEFDSNSISSGLCAVVWQSTALTGSPVSPVFDPSNNLTLVCTLSGVCYSIYTSGGSAGTVKNSVTMTTGGNTYITANTPCVSGGKIFVVSQRSASSAVRLFAYNTVDLSNATGWSVNPAATTWTYSPSGANASPLCAGGMVLFDSPDSGGSFVAVNQSDGTLPYAEVTLSAQPLASFALDLRSPASVWVNMASVAQLRRIKISDGTTIENLTTTDNSSISGYPAAAITIAGTSSAPYLITGLNQVANGTKAVVLYDLITKTPVWTAYLDSGANGQFPIIDTGNGTAMFTTTKTGGVVVVSAVSGPSISFGGKAPVISGGGTIK